jgi:hypothetical protein
MFSLFLFTFSIVCLLSFFFPSLSLSLYIIYISVCMIILNSDGLIPFFSLN